jgi:hypothetical protein
MRKVKCVGVTPKSWKVKCVGVTPKSLDPQVLWVADRNHEAADTDFSFVENLAKWSGRTVTAVAGDIIYDPDEKDGPDYEFMGDLWEVHPDGSRKLLWKYLTEEQKNTDRGRAYMRDHPQPY